jgi:hypothetical protein
MLCGLGVFHISEVSDGLSLSSHFKWPSDWWYTYPSEKYEFVNGKDYLIDYEKS